MEEFKDELPETTDFKVGYFYGKQSAKRWIVTQEDSDAMYETGKEAFVMGRCSCCILRWSGKSESVVIRILL